MTAGRHTTQAADDARAMHGSCVLADEGFSAGL